jgi:hypothetical protein
LLLHSWTVRWSLGVTAASAPQLPGSSRLPSLLQGMQPCTFAAVGMQPCTSAAAGNAAVHLQRHRAPSCAWLWVQPLPCPQAAWHCLSPPPTSTRAAHFQAAHCKRCTHCTRARVHAGTWPARGSASSLQRTSAPLWRQPYGKWPASTNTTQRSLLTPSCSKAVNRCTDSLCRMRVQAIDRLAAAMGARGPMQQERASLEGSCFGVAADLNSALLHGRSFGVGALWAARGASSWACLRRSGPRAPRGHNPS